MGSEFKYVGEVPDYLIIQPLQNLGNNMAHCSGCHNTIHFMNFETAICPYCASKQTKEPNNE